MSDRRRKLTALQVNEIRRERRRGKKLRELATLYHVSVGRVSLIVNGFSWKFSPLPSEDGPRYKKAQRGVGSAVSYAIKKGLLPDLKAQVILCVDCKKARATQYDHRDYRKPLDVEAVCGPCNHKRPRARC